MLIELGPTVTLPADGWTIRIGNNGLRQVFVSWHYYLLHGKRKAWRMAAVSARLHGFDIDEYGNVTNWYAVPQLWKLSW